MADGVYVHIPFCIHKCPYCDFLSFPGAERGDFSQYARTAAAQMRLWKEKRIRADTLFFGGGTPSLLGADNLCRLLDAARESFCFCDDAEITLEANPGTADAPMLRTLAGAGFTRISFGVQSFCDATLRAIGRIHTAAQARDAVKMAQDAGFSRVSIDLMSALPGQDMAQIAEGAREAIALGVTHVSCYDLTIAPDTPFGAMQEKLNLPSQEESLLMQRLFSALLQQAGFVRYEISNYARGGDMSRHNLHYWHNDAYVGIGCGAHGRYDMTRYTQAQTLADYAHDVAQGRRWHDVEEVLTPQEDVKETLMLGMRLAQGVDFEALLAKLDPPVQMRWRMLARQYESMGLLQREGARLFATPHGWEVQNAWLCTFL